MAWYSALIRSLIADSLEAAHLAAASGDPAAHVLHGPSGLIAR
jgi:hypothetical protein